MTRAAATAPRRRSRSSCPGSRARPPRGPARPPRVHHRRADGVEDDPPPAGQAPAAGQQLAERHAARRGVPAGQVGQLADDCRVGRDVGDQVAPSSTPSPSSRLPRVSAPMASTSASRPGRPRSAAAGRPGSRSGRSRPRPRPPRVTRRPQPGLPRRGQLPGPGAVPAPHPYPAHADDLGQRGHRLPGDRPRADHRQHMPARAGQLAAATAAMAPVRIAVMSAESRTARTACRPGRRPRSAPPSSRPRGAGWP